VRDFRKIPSPKRNKTALLMISIFFIEMSFCVSVLSGPRKP
jgi:hypothetical protein